ncbi:hypothetical protein ACVJBD_000967 [Rhizobium mongolense]
MPRSPRRKQDPECRFFTASTTIVRHSGTQLSRALFIETYVVQTHSRGKKRQRIVNLVICCDGTWNTPDVTENGVPSPTDIVRLYNAPAPSDAGEWNRSLVITRASGLTARAGARRSAAAPARGTRAARLAFPMTWRFSTLRCRPLPPVLTEITCSSAKLQMSGAAAPCPRDVFDTFADAVKHSDGVMERATWSKAASILSHQGTRRRYAGPPAISFRSDSAAARRAETHTYAVEEEVTPAGLLPI